MGALSSARASEWAMRSASVGGSEEVPGSGSSWFLSLW